MKTVLLVDSDAGRTQKIQDLLIRAGVNCAVFSDWQEVSVQLVLLAPSLVVLDLGTLGVETASVADIELMTQGTAAVLFHAGVESWKVELMEQQSDFGSVLPWPDDNDALSAALNDVFPGIVGGADTGGGHDSWLDFDALVAQARETRLSVPMPSLTRGSLASTSTPRLLYFLAVQRRSGVLTLEQQDQAVEVLLRDGRLLYTEESRARLARAQASFGWSRGSYRFAWRDTTSEPGRPVGLLPFLYQGIATYVSVNDIAMRLLRYEEGYPVFTTLFLGRFQAQSRFGMVKQVGQACTGERSLSQLMATMSADLEEVSRAFAFLLHTDGVHVLDEPGEAPAGVTYRMHHRLEDLAATRTQDILGSGTEPSTAFDREEGTRFQIAQLSAAHQELLGHYEALQRQLIESDPYTVFDLAEGCGRHAVRQAYETILAHLPEPPADMPAPLKVTVHLVRDSLRDTYFLLSAQETTDGPRSGNAPKETSSVPFSLEDILKAVTISQHAAAEVEATRSGFTREPTVNRPRDPSLMAQSSNNPGDATEHFDLGQKCLKARDYDLARQAFEIAHRAQPRNGLFLAYLGWATFLNNPGHPGSARVMLKRALTLEGGVEMGAFVLGTIAMQGKKYNDAREYFTTVLERRPDNREAQRALRMIALREGSV